VQGLALGAIALASVLTYSSSGGATSPASQPLTPVSGGVSASALPGSTVFGTTPANTPETVSFVLTEQNQGSLEYQVEHGVQNYLSTAQFAYEYAQPLWEIQQLESYLNGYGIQTTLYADHVDLSTTGTAGQYDQALSVQQHQYHVPAHAGSHGLRGEPAQTIHGITTAPELPRNLASFVTAILGLTNYAPFSSNAVHVSSTDAVPQKGSTNACLALVGLPNACNTPQTFASNYGLSQLYRHADGAGQTVAIVTLAAVDPGAPQYYWQNIVGIPNTGRTVTINNIDGGPGAPNAAAGSGESDLDVEQSGGIAYGSNVVVYQAPNTDSGFADAFFDAASQNIASDVSASWGESETYLQAAIASGVETPSYLAAFDEAFLEMAVQGQSGFLSSGDSGAYDASGDLGTTNLSVDTSADSPYITSSGGTSLPWSGEVAGPVTSAPASNPTQRAWGWDYLWQAMATANGTTLAAAAEGAVVGDGGGYSTDYATPSYQQGVSGTNVFHAVQYLQPATYTNVGGIVEPTTWNFNPTPSVSGGPGGGRVEPDVSTDADPFSGYLLYSPSFATQTPAAPVLEGGWGGTSFVAPQLNGSTAVIDSLLGHRVGLWNPAIYAMASSQSSPFVTMNSVGTGNDNVYYSGNPGDVYNPATGLGYPDLAVVAYEFGLGRY
jgi:subtilase family serine protease